MRRLPTERCGFRAVPIAVLCLGAAAVLSGCAQAEPRTVLQGFGAGDGRPLWSVELGGRGSSATEPVIVGGTVFVGPIAYGLADGRRRWVQRQTGELPDAVAGDLAVSSSEGRVVARRADTGAVAWTRRTPGTLVQSHEDGPIALVVDPSPLPDTSRGPGNPPPIVGSRVSLLDPATGKDLWRRTLPGRVDTFSSAVSTRQILAAYGTDYTGNRTVAALRTSDGSTAWSVPAGPALSHVVTAGDVPALVSGGDTDHAAVLDPATGRQLWEVKGSKGLARRWPFVDVVAGEPGYAARRDPRTGAELPGRVPVLYGVAAYGDMLVGSAGRALTAARDADRLWAARLPAGERPITYVDLNDDVVVTVTQVNHPRERD